MAKKILISVTIMFLLSLNLSAMNSQEEDPFSLRTGNELLDALTKYEETKSEDDFIIQIYAAGYVMGVYWMCVKEGYVGFSDGITRGQIDDVVIKYLRDNPEKRHMPPNFLILDALKEAFPIKE